MKIVLSRLTSKFQATIPKKVRQTLHLGKGDRITYEIQDDNTVTIRKTTPLDAEYLNAISDTLNEWLSDEDEEAYNNL